MRRDSYDHAEALWGEHPPFEMSIFVMTSRLREDDVREGTTFSSVESMARALERAVQATGGKAIVLHRGGAIQQGLRAGALDELQLHLVLVILGMGRRLFSELGDEPTAMKIIRVAEGPTVTHLKCRVSET